MIIPTGKSRIDSGFDIPDTSLDANAYTEALAAVATD